MLSHSGFLLLVLTLSMSVPGAAETYEQRRDLLSVAAPFSPDACDFETALDARSFSELLGLAGPKVVDNAAGWSVEARTGGRPFLCLDRITVNGSLWPFDPAGFSPGTSGIPQSELDAHFAAGKTVNRLWFVHPASNGFPIVVVLTPDGFFNVSAAEPPRLQGAATRVGFVGEPFDLSEDYLQHTDDLEIEEIDGNTLLLLFDVHSEAGEGVVELELVWKPGTEEPELRFRSAHLPRFAARLGFVGLNFLRGPTYSGLLSEFGTPEGGIEAFHDGRSVFLEEPGGTVVRSLLTPPASPGPILREDLAPEVPAGSRLFMDQPQGAVDYFSKFPAVPYEDRTDLVLELLSASASPVSVRRAQRAVDLEDPNPEANETANVFFAVDMVPGRTDELSYRLGVAAEDFEAAFPALERGVVYVSDRDAEEGSLFFLPVGDDLQPTGAPRRLTDGVILGPRRPSASPSGRFVIFDVGGVSSRIHLLDLWRGTVRRLTVDPFGSSRDLAPSLSPDGQRFALATSRRGTPLQVNVEEVATGLGSGFGHTATCGGDTDWSPVRDEIAVTCGAELQLYEVATGQTTPLVTRAGMRAPKVSPGGERVAYVANTGVYVIRRDGTGDTRISTEGEHPTWLDGSALIVDHTVGGETDLFRVDVATSQSVRWTPSDGVSCSEPVAVFPGWRIFRDGFESGDRSAWGAGAGG